MLFDNKVAKMTPGEALLDAPMPELIQRMGIAIAEAQLKLVGEGLSSFLVGAKSKELTEIVAVLQGLTFAEALGKRLDRIAAALAGIADAVEAEARQVFAEIDRWIVDAAALCQVRDPQLDLRGALPAVPAPRPSRQTAAAVA